MSVKVLTWVWEHSQAAGNDLLVLLAIADAAHDDGAGAYPSIPTLAVKCRLSERTVQRCVQTLAALDELVVIPHGAALPNVRADRRPNAYRVVMRRGVNLSPRGSDGVSQQAQRGDTGDVITVLEPSLPPNPADAGGCAKHRDKPGPNCRACGTNVRALNAAAKKAKPSHCGRCDPDTRLIDTPEGPARCPACHPLSRRTAGQARGQP